MTPPVLLAQAARTGEMPTCCAVICWRFPNSTLDAVSLPVSATPNQPSSGEKNGNNGPVLAKASPRVESTPAYRDVKASASIAAIVSNENRTFQNVRT